MATQRAERQANREKTVTANTKDKKVAANTRPVKKGVSKHRVATAKSKAPAKKTRKTPPTTANKTEPSREKTSERTQTPLVKKRADTAHKNTVLRSSKSTMKGGVKFSATELEGFHKDLLALRDRLATQIEKMRESALKRDDEVNPEEDGTDAFDRLFTLERAGTDQKTINQINNALRAIKEGTYGTCELCDGLIESARLHALPFVKNCVACQSELERQRNGRAAAPRRVIP